MKRFGWILALSMAYLLIAALRFLSEQHPPALRPPLNEAELGI